LSQFKERQLFRFDLLALLPAEPDDLTPRDALAVDGDEARSHQ
jgi:hypothetical protein